MVLSDVVAHAYNHHTREVKPRGLPSVQSQPGQFSKTLSQNKKGWEYSLVQMFSPQEHKKCGKIPVLVTGQHVYLSESGANSIHIEKLVHLFPRPGISSLRYTVGSLLSLRSLPRYHYSGVFLLP